MGNGMVERVNSSLLSMLRIYVNNGKRPDWDQCLGSLAGAYNNAQHASTGFTPHMLMFGHESYHVASVLYGNPNHKSYSNYGEFMQEKLKAINAAHTLARQNMTKSYETQKRNYDVKINQTAYKIGDPVWLLNEQRVTGVSPKLQNVWVGPFPILEKLNELNYKIQYNKKGDTRIIHHNKIKMFIGEQMPTWVKKVIKDL